MAQHPRPRHQCQRPGAATRRLPSAETSTRPPRRQLNSPLNGANGAGVRQRLRLLSGKRPQPMSTITAGVDPPLVWKASLIRLEWALNPLYGPDIAVPILLMESNFPERRGGNW